MKCYRINCKEECNVIKVKYCLFKLTEKQTKLIAEIKKDENIYCQSCGEYIVDAEYKDKEIKLCTSCGIAKANGIIIEKCLVNSRRV